MVKIVIRLVCLSVFALLLTIPSMAQNTKGDKPKSDRETRFQKTSKKPKSQKRISSRKRNSPGVRAYKPSKKSKGGERVGQSFGQRPRSRPGREGSQNVYSQRGFYVNNKSQSGQNTEKRNAARAGRTRVAPRSSSGSTRNVYPQTGRYVQRNPPPRRRPIYGTQRTVTPRSASGGQKIYRRGLNTWAHFPRPKQKKEKAYSGDITGRRVRTRNYETQRPPIITAPSTRPGTKTKSAEARGGYRNNRYVSGNATSPRVGQRPVSNKSTLARLNRLQSRKSPKSGRRVQVVPRSASGQFIKRRSTNVWAHFPRPKRKGERAVTTDIAGKPLRTRNYRSPRPGLLESSPRLSGGADRPYKGPASGSYRSITRSGRSWKGDVARRRLIDRNTSSDRGFRGKAAPGGYRTRSGEMRPGQGPIPVRTPKSGFGIGSYSGNIKRGRKGFGDQGEGFSGNVKSRRAAKGGGSVSGRLWNNDGSPNPVRTPGIGANGLGKYQGNIRGRKGFNPQGEGYSGSIKSRRAAKGGGSVSGKLWNNDGQPNPVRPPGAGADRINYSGNIRGRKKTFSDQGEEYSGNIRGRKIFRDQGEEYSGNIRGRKIFQNQGEEFSGAIKARRPAKGGGSVSGKLWNNNESAIPTRSPSKAAMQAGGFPGKIRTTDAHPSYQNQGEEFTGNIKARRPAKGGGSVSGKLWNNDEQPIQVRAPKSEQGGEFAGNIKLRKGYVRNPNAADEALKKRREKTTYLTDGLQVRVSQHPYGKKPHAAEGSMPGWKPSRETVRASEFTKVIRSYRYVRNGSSADEALKVREPGKAFARATDFQGNIKMKKFDLFGDRQLHPDAQFVKINRNNVAGEKSALTNFKLWWARLFKKNDTLPGHLKDKGHKPRYDKGEQGLWYD